MAGDEKFSHLVAIYWRTLVKRHSIDNASTQFCLLAQYLLAPDNAPVLLLIEACCATFMLSRYLLCGSNSFTSVQSLGLCHIVGRFYKFASRSAYTRTFHLTAQFAPSWQLVRFMTTNGGVDVVKLPSLGDSISEGTLTEWKIGPDHPFSTQPTTYVRSFILCSAW